MKKRIVMVEDSKGDLEKSLVSNKRRLDITQVQIICWSAYKDIIIASVFQDLESVSQHSVHACNLLITSIEIINHVLVCYMFHAHHGRRFSMVLVIVIRGIKI